jgi:hypothetical protein
MRELRFFIEREGEKPDKLIFPETPIDFDARRYN